MIPSATWLVAASLLAPPPTDEPAQEEEAATQEAPEASPVDRNAAEPLLPDDLQPEPDESLSRFRTPFEVLTERTIGTASRPVKFDWRKTTVQVAATGSQLAELNNFNSVRAGGMARLPSAGLIFELGLTYVWVWDTPSSERLALTPYRQPARPNRLEVDFAVGFPLAEGVVTTFPGFFPAVELVFNAYADFRYLVYPTAFSGMGFRKTAGAIFSPTITSAERRNLEDDRLAAMQVDAGRYGLLVGFGTDIYFQSGFFISPRILLAVPIMAPATETELQFWLDFSLAIGLAI